MAKRGERKKASDVYRESLFYPGEVSFDKAFPEIEDVIIRVKEIGKGVPEKTATRTYKRANLPGEHIDCSNPMCYKGGFSIGRILRSMVRNRQTEFETSELCQGHEASPKGNRVIGKCLNDFEIKVSIKYKEGQPKSV